MEQKKERLIASYKEFAKHANKEYQVKELCGSYVDRLEKLKAAKGDRLPT